MLAAGTRPAVCDYTDKLLILESLNLKIKVLIYLVLPGLSEVG